MAGGMVQWFAVRCLFDDRQNRPWGPHDLTMGEHAYEERITLWVASSPDEAIKFAEGEARVYASSINSEYLGLAQSYMLEGEPREGGEAFSLIRRSRLDPDAYADHFFNTGLEYQRELPDR